MSQFHSKRYETYRNIRLDAGKTLLVFIKYQVLLKTGSLYDAIQGI